METTGYTALGVVAAVVAGYMVHRALFMALRLTGDSEPEGVMAVFRERCRAPSAVVLPLLVVFAVLPYLPVVPGTALPVRRILGVLLVLAVSWFFIRLTGVLEAALLRRFRTDVADNLRARKVHTQIRILRQMVVVTIAVLAFAVILLSFDSLRRLGAGILASAGLAGIILGLAAQKTLGNLIAGFQIAVTQPIRLDDVVIVDGEWGRVEEITLTYVVVRIWDKRRLIVPISRFVEGTFQNWTRTEAGILGTVFLWVDYRTPVDEVRAALGRIVETSSHWDGEVWRLQVTDATERAVQLRALMSAPDSSSAWELRCEVREQLLEVLRKEHPDALPRIRAELEPRFRPVGGS